MTKTELDGIAFAIRTTKKKKGAGKGYKYFYTKEWSGAMTCKEYLDRLGEIDPKACGELLCRVEHSDFTECRWWDVPSYRDEAIKDYRGRIKAIRLKYGMSQAEVAKYMRVEPSAD